MHADKSCLLIYRSCMPISKSYMATSKSWMHIYNNWMQISTCYMRYEKFFGTFATKRPCLSVFIRGGWVFYNSW
jgi:hypothetical protein